MTADDWSAVGLTAALAGCTTVLLLLAGAPLAWWLARTRSVFKPLASALVAADETCEAYDVLVQSAAELRCRRIDGVADLIDRQLATLRGQLGPDGFEPLLREAQRRRRLRASKD